MDTDRSPGRQFNAVTVLGALPNFGQTKGASVVHTPMLHRNEPHRRPVLSGCAGLLHLSADKPVALPDLEGISLRVSARDLDGG